MQKRLVVEESITGRFDEICKCDKIMIVGLCDDAEKWACALCGAASSRRGGVSPTRPTPPTPTRRRVCTALAQKLQPRLNSASEPLFSGSSVTCHNGNQRQCTKPLEIVSLVGTKNFLGIINMSKRRMGHMFKDMG